MPNIAIIDYCNLKCPYCFANDYIQNNQPKTISIEELYKIFNFLKKGIQPNNRIGIIGGEPTLHPNFKEILNEIITFSKDYHLRPPTVFSNGILLGQYSFLFNHDATALINLNHPDIVGNTKWSQIEYSLKNLEAAGAFDNKRITIGINLYENMKDWSYIFEIAKKYNLSEIRCSVVAPTCNIVYNTKDTYYENNKQLFLNFVKDANQNNIIVRLDCNSIPLCYFSDDEKTLIYQTVKNFKSYCTPVIDITPDYKAISCFGVGIPVDLNDFENLEHLTRYFQMKQINSLIKNNKIGKCKDCPKIDNFSCQGGCLAFAK